jgi:hypothetical protein
MRLVLDMQGFKDERNRFIPKELAAYDGDRISHFVFRPPYPLKLLSQNLQNNAVWLMRNHHCLNWNSGFTPLHYFAKIMSYLTKDAEHVYVKGGEKAEFIRKYCRKKVIELDDQPALQKDEPLCFYHNKSICMCALTNVLSLYDNIFMNE